jgi:O-methyltransferase
VSRNTTRVSTLRDKFRSAFAAVGIKARTDRSNETQEHMIPDAELYRPLFSPWLGQREFEQYYALAAPRTLVSSDRCYVLWTLLRQAMHINGDIWECGVYKGGTAAMMAAVLRDRALLGKRLFLFDTFRGMPKTDAEKDIHEKGDFKNTSVEAVSRYVGADEICVLRQGLIPDTFKGLESAQIALAHIDVDIYKSVLDCMTFIWPRLTLGGFMIFDDYGFPTCPGARAAVDEFFAAKDCEPLCLPTGQAVVFKGIV